MQKKIFNLMLAGILLIFIPACNNDDDTLLEEPIETASLRTTITFSESNSNDLKAASSTAIPTTSWQNIQNMQLFLYDATTGGSNNGIIKATKDIVVSDLTGTAAPWQYLWENVPVGNYRLGIVANGAKNTDDVVRVVGATELTTEWGYNNLFDRNINTVFLQHKPTTNPSGSSITGGWYIVPSEIFTAYSTPFAVTEGQTANVGALQLKRDVSMMRVRLNTNGYEASIDFANAASYLRIQRLPTQLNISHDGGRVANNVLMTGKIQAGAGTGTFESADPTSGYDTGVIVDSAFTLWKDIIIFPNMARDSYVASAEPPVQNQERYGIVISGVVRAGATYTDASGITVSPGSNVYWYGIVNAGFFNNMIREVNITLDTNGTGDEPEELEFGNVNISLNAPLPWDSAILDIDISM